ncbi:MAG: S8 family peptidase, partial [Clostridiales bacterium]|nr:S8 family peptidase [Clostridiales bacterium]
GSGILDEYLSEASDGYQTCIIVPTGNEANYGGHYRNVLRVDETYKDIEIRVGENEVGFSLELWASAPSVFTVGFISPSGEYIQRIPPRTDGNQTVSFLFEPTIIYVGYRIIELRTGDELILMRFNRPTPGIWKVRVFMEQNFNNPFDLWLPIQEFLSSDTQFIQPDPDITITSPGNAEAIITVAAYNHTNNAIFINSGRGFTRSGRIKPDIAAPGVNIYGPIPGNLFSVRSGTSIAAAHAAGAAALLMEWGVVQQNNTFFDTSDVKALMIKGARRSEGTYPNREYGYGTLDVFGAFESLRTTL